MWEIERLLLKYVIFTDEAIFRCRKGKIRRWINSNQHNLISIGEKKNELLDAIKKEGEISLTLLINWTLNIT